MATPQTHTFRLRNAKPSDGEAINKLCIEAYEQFRSVIGEASWLRLRDALAHAAELTNKGELIVAADASGVLGVVLYLKPQNEQDFPSKVASLQTLAVSPAHRSKGIGRSLTRECIDRARKDGADAVALTTAEMMTVARPMYERMGFIKESDLGERFGVKHARYILKLK